MTLYYRPLVVAEPASDRLPLAGGACLFRDVAVLERGQPSHVIPARDVPPAILARLTAPDPSWPEGTRQISELRLSLRVQPTGLLSGLTGPRTVHIDIVDYPGEWLLDLGLLDLGYEQWSKAAIARAKGRPLGDEFLQMLQAVDPDAPLNEVQAKSLTAAFTAHLNAS
uniref:YcjX family protein n=1 Tax=Yoonia sp. TaxID=2212373 RepID=UPI0040477997